MLKNYSFYLHSDHIHIKTENKKYERFYHTKSYISEKSKEYNERNPIEVLSVIVGYKNLQKFQAHRSEWNSLKRQVPLSYIEAIEADIEVIKFCVEQDLLEYKELENIKKLPSFVTAVIVAPFFKQIELPLGLESEEEIVEYSKLNLVQNHREVRIKIGDYKTLRVFNSGKVQEVFYYPTVRFSRCWMIPEVKGYKD